MVLVMHRRSHGGSVFNKVFFYDQEAEDWQPLNALREKLGANNEKEFLQT
jgi:hypothetical protein